MFLVKSELSIITYLFLVFYKSTSLYSRSFLNIHGGFSVEVEIIDYSLKETALELQYIL